MNLLSMDNNPPHFKPKVNPKVWLKLWKGKNQNLCYKRIVDGGQFLKRIPIIFATKLFELQMRLLYK